MKILYVFQLFLVSGSSSIHLLSLLIFTNNLKQRETNTEIIARY